MHLIAGLILASIFQPAHVMPVSEFPVPDNDGTIENSWTVHQLATTTDFAPTSKIFTWFVGGLNFQIEHHLFPTICHVHYRNLSKIVKQTTRDFNIGYNEQSNFIKALYNHGKMLYNLGKFDMVHPIVVKSKK
jgi:linoleoyl-CoA desaturase